MNLTIRDQPIFEDESQAKQAMDDMANTLRLVSVASLCCCHIPTNMLRSKLSTPESGGMQAPFEDAVMFETQFLCQTPATKWQQFSLCPM